MMNMIPNRKEKGFTLIELVMVIVILGILAAFALPRFADLGQDATRASLEGDRGAVKSASAIAHSKCLASADCDASADSGQSVTLEGNNSVDMVYGYIAGTSTAIENAVDLADFDVTDDSGVVTIADDDNTCRFTYTQAPAANDTPDIDSAVDCSAQSGTGSGGTP